MIETKLSLKKRDEKRDFRGILAINDRHSSPRQIIEREGLIKSSSLFIL